MEMTEFEDQAVSLVASYVEKRRVAMPLALLGAMLKERGFDLRATLGGKTLSSFLKEKASDRLVVRPSLHDPKTFGVAPIDAAKPGFDPFRNLGERLDKIVSDDVKVPEISNAARLAFTRVIPDGMARVITLQPKFKFKDIKSSLIEGELVVDPKMVVGRLEGEGEAPYEARILSSISDWARQNKLSFEHIKKVKALKSSAKSLLESIIDNLSEDQMSRVLLPLDVVAILRSR